MTKIKKVSAKKIQDSRGDLTVEATVELSDGTLASASVPGGKSKGGHEAVYLPAEVAVVSIEEIIGKEIIGLDPIDQEALDKRLIELDSTPEKSKLGANSVLAVSFASAKAAAGSQSKPLWKHLRELSGLKVADNKSPRLFVNVINGGRHAENNLPFQEHIVIVKEGPFSEQIEKGKKFYYTLGEKLRVRAQGGMLKLGDEGGYASDFRDWLEPFEILNAVRTELGAKEDYDFGLDAAADNIDSSEEELATMYKKISDEFGVIYIEDPFSEEKFQEFSTLKGFMPNITICGDDLTVTDVARMKKAKESDSINGIIIKPNQIGTLSEALSAVRLAREWGWYTVVSHRSGETMDSWIADFACGVGADGFKLGAPSQPDRLAKYNRLLSIEKEGK